MGNSIFVTGGTGYIGSRLIPALIMRGHKVKALVRKGSEADLPDVAECVVGDALRMDFYQEHVRGADFFVHLIGVPHPSPAKTKQFREIDLVSIEVAIKAASAVALRHFIYLSVARPAPVMKAFIDVRQAGEEMIRASGIPATFLRPWYVLGPGHRWPCVLLPFYWIAERLPPTKESAQRLGFVTVSQIVNALVWTVENPPNGIRIVDVPRIRELASSG